MKRLSGFGIIGVIATVAVVALVGLLAWLGYDAWQNNSSDSVSTSESKAAESLPEVNTKDDLDAAESAVLEVNPDSLDTVSIDETIQ